MNTKVNIALGLVSAVYGHLPQVLYPYGGIVVAEAYGKNKTKKKTFQFMGRIQNSLQGQSFNYQEVFHWVLSLKALPHRSSIMA